MRQCVATACGRGRPVMRPGAESEGFGTFDLPDWGAKGYQPSGCAIRLEY
jgi:hypothetical protein